MYPALAKPEDPHVLYQAFDQDGELIYVGITYDLDHRIQVHQSASWWWRPQVYLVTMKLHPDMAAARRAETELIKERRPRWNDQHNH